MALRLPKPQLLWPRLVARRVGITHTRTVLGAVETSIIPTLDTLAFLVSVLYHQEVKTLHTPAPVAVATHQGTGIIQIARMFQASADGLMSLPRQLGSVEQANVDTIPVNRASVHRESHSQDCQVRA